VDEYVESQNVLADDEQMKKLVMRDVKLLNLIASPGLRSKAQSTFSLALALWENFRTSD